MPRFIISGVGTETGRKRKAKIYQGYDQEEAMQKAESDGTTIESCKVLPDDKPTQRQIEYAKSVGIQVTENTTKEEIGDLLTNYQEDYAIADKTTKSLAKSYRIETTKFTSQEAIINQISYKIFNQGNDKEFVTWFLYNVAFNLDLDTKTDLLENLGSLADEFMANDKALKSLKTRHQEGRGIEQIRFDSTEFNRTESYIFARDILKHRYGIKRGSFNRKSTNKNAFKEQPQVGFFKKMNHLSSMEQISIVTIAFIMIIYFVFF